MRVLVLGLGTVGGPLLEALRGAGHEAEGLARTEFDVTSGDPGVGEYDLVYLCAAKARFIDCEEDPKAYRVNVDAPLYLARRSRRLVYLSSDAVERAIHTAYGMHKALAETALAAFPNVLVARICVKVTPENIPRVVAGLLGCLELPAGLVRIA